MSQYGTTQASDEAQFFAGVIYEGRELVWSCDHRHRTEDAAERCAAREWNR